MQVHLQLARKVINMNACVIVYGDLGHSPRMQNHALSLAD